jgi:PAS domain-containing protein
MIKHTVLRHRAESLLALSADEIDVMRQKEIKELIQELQTHQFELEMQNRELRRAQEELLAFRQKSCDLWDFSPLACLELSADGLVVDCNFTGCKWFGRTHEQIKSEKFARFVAPESQDDVYLHYRKLFSTGEPQHCELRLKEGARLVRASSHAPASATGCCYTSLTDMTDVVASLPRAGDFGAHMQCPANTIIN